MICKCCKGERWVCVNHRDQPWDACEFCDADEGIACVCNPDQDMPPGTEVIAKVDDLGVFRRSTMRAKRSSAPLKQAAP